MARAAIDGSVAFLARKSFNKHNIISDGKTLYSYGDHFPMAVHDDGSSNILVNTAKYSQTTGKHQSALRGVLHEHGYSPTGEERKEEYRYHRGYDIRDVIVKLAVWSKTNGA